MTLSLVIVAAVVAVCVALVAAVAALVIGLRGFSGTRSGKAKSDVVWIVIGLTVIALVCCLAMGAAAVFLFGVPLFAISYIVC